MSVFSPPAPASIGDAAASSSAGSSLSLPALSRPPLALPALLSEKTFYLSPIANPDLVLALIIPGHPQYSGHALPHSGSEAHLARDAAAANSASSSSGASGLAKFFGSAANTVTNTAASAVGVKNQLELNKVKLKLVPRTLPTVSSSPLSHALNQRWVMRGDGCIYSCVEQQGGQLYRLGSNKNQMIRVKSKEEGTEGSTTAGEQLPGVTTPTSPGEGAASTTARDISSTRSGIAAAGKASSASDASGGDGPASPTGGGKSQLISVTTARGDTVVCPRRWEVQKPVGWKEVKNSIEISGMHVVIEDTEAAANQNFGMVGLLSRAASAAQHGLEAIAAATVGTSGSGGSAGRDTSCLLVIKDICCGNLDCELERIEEGATCGFKQTRADDDDEKEAKGKSPKNDKSSSSGGDGCTPGVSTLATRQGPSIKQIWRVESDFSIWLSSLSRAVSTEYGITRKLQKIESERAARREAAPKPQEHTPLRLTIDYEYASIWSTEGTKAAQPLSIWRPKASSGVFFGDYIVQGLSAPSKKESLVVSCAQGGPLHRALVRPIDFELVWTKKKGKNGPLYVWAPIAPPGVDALALGHIATTGGKEDAAKPSVTCGVVMVLREYLKDSGHALSHQLWADTNIGGGTAGSFWRPGGHSHTFFCNPGSHSPPTGSYYMLLEPQESPEIAPLLRPMETSNSGWDPVWDDKGTLAKMDVSVWRPKLDRNFVRFGDQIVRGHAPPSNLAVVARDHPAFRRPKAFELATKIYRGARKCYVFRPIPPSEEYLALGFAVSASKDEPPLPDMLRCVHRDALIPLGVLKQMWVEHHAGMMSTLTLGVTTMLTLSRDYPVNMLWKNRSLNTFIAVQNTHARPQQFAAGAVYRLTMTANELAHTVSILETHARWVLESLYGALFNLAHELEEADFMELSISPAQACTLFQAVKGVFKYLRSDGPGGAPAFNISAPFQAYLKEYESTRLRAVEKAFKRHLYQLICEEVSDHEYTLGALDECWDLLAQLSDVHRTYDDVAAWTPPCTAKFPGSQLKSLSSIILDDQIGKEIFERFLAAFPPRVSERGMDDVEDQGDDEELPVILSGSAAAAAAAAVSGGKGASPASARRSLKGTDASADDAATAAKLKPLPSASEASSAQFDETQAILAKLQTLADELHLVRRLTESMELRKRYLEWYQTYLTHVLHQEFPLSGSTARLGSTGAKLGMGSLRAVVGWACLYIEVVEQALLEGDRDEARSVLSKMDDVVERLMDVHDDLAKNKVLAWISNLLRMEERAPAELREEIVEDSKHNKVVKHFYFTSGPTDLFGNLNTLFESQSQKDHPTQRLRNRPLARIALVHVHVLTYYQQVQTQFFKQLRAVPDSTTHLTVSGKGAPPVDTPHAGSLNKPYAYILAQINNTAQYQSMVENFQDEVLQLLGADDAPDEIMSSLEDAFALCGEEFQTLALGATEVLIRHVAQQLEAPFAQMFLERTWGTEEAYLHTHVLEPLDLLCSHFAPNIQPSICATHLMRETARGTLRAYIRAFTLQLKGPLPSSGVMSPAAVAERIRSDACDLREYLEGCKQWSVLQSCEKWLSKIDLLAEFISADVDFLKIHVEETKKLFQGDADFSPALMLYTLLALRSDVESDERKRWLAPYAAEIKALEESRRPKLPKVSPSDVGKFFQKITTSSSSTPPLEQRGSVGGPSSPDSSLGEEYGLEVHLVRGIDLAVKDVTTSDPYVNILLLRQDGSRLAKHGSKVVSKNLNPQWNETFSKWRVSDVAQLDRIRFEVFDKDFIGKDFMGQAEVTVGDIRSKQLLERRTVLTSTDHTQEWMAFHLKLAQNPGKKNEGSDLVSGHIDVKIRYFKTSGSSSGSSVAVHPVAHPVAKASSALVSASNDDLDFEPEDAGQTGSKRPPAASDSAGVGSAAPARTPSPDAIPARASVSEAPTSSTHVLEAAASAPLWSDIVGSIKLKRPSLAGSSPAAPKPPSAFRRQATLRALDKKHTLYLAPPPSTTAARRNSTSRGSRRGSSAAAATSAADGTEATTSAQEAHSPKNEGGEVHTRKLKKKSDKDNFNIFKLF